MRPEAITVDYFLRDNRTRAPLIGKDWGIKAATGTLAARADLRATFNRYCRALRGDRGSLRGFGQAIGGIRTEDGYLLCVTLETSDSFGRPSWATYGLWCPGGVVAEVVTCDPAETVRALLGVANPPSAITLRPSTAEPSLSDADTEHPLRPFKRHSTHTEVLSLLHEAQRLGTPTPNILGITASLDLSSLLEAFDVVYCHPQDDDTRRAFEHLRARTIVRPPTVAESTIDRRAVERRISRRTLAVVIATCAVSLCTSRSTPIRPLALRLKAIDCLDPRDLRRTMADRQKIRDAYASLIELRERIVHRPDSELATIRGIYSFPRGRQPPAEACKAIHDAIGIEFEAPDSTVRRWCESLVELEMLTKSPGGLGTGDRARRKPS